MIHLQHEKPKQCGGKKSEENKDHAGKTLNKRKTIINILKVREAIALMKQEQNL